MPHPTKGESKEAFIPRAIRYLKKEHPEMSHKQIVKLAHVYWEKGRREGARQGLRKQK